MFLYWISLVDNYLSETPIYINILNAYLESLFDAGLEYLVEVLVVLAVDHLVHVDAARLVHPEANQVDGCLAAIGRREQHALNGSEDSIFMQ